MLISMKKSYVNFLYYLHFKLERKARVVSEHFVSLSVRNQPLKAGVGQELWPLCVCVCVC